MKIVENITWFSQLVGAKKTDLYEKYDLYGLYADLAIITKFENGETKSLYLPLKSTTYNKKKQYLFTFLYKI